MSAAKSNRPAGRLKAEEDENDAGNFEAKNQRLIYSLKDDDVLLGRGQHVKHIGNNRFRTMVHSRAVEYCACPSKAGKDVIARQIMGALLDQGGRFVRKAETGSKSAATGSTGDEEISAMNQANVWEIVDEATVLVKVKQTFRDYSVARKAAIARKRSSFSASSARVALPLPQSHVASLPTTRPVAAIGNDTIFNPQHPITNSSTLAMLQSSHSTQQRDRTQSFDINLRPFQPFEASYPIQRLLLHEAVQRDQQRQHQHVLSILEQQRDLPLLTSWRVNQMLAGASAGHSPNVANTGISANVLPVSTFGGFPSLSSPPSRFITQDVALQNHIMQQQQQHHQQSATLLAQLQHGSNRVPQQSLPSANDPASLQNILESLLQQRQTLVSGLQNPIPGQPSPGSDGTPHPAPRPLP